MIKGLNGRLYNTDGKRIESTVEHPEYRTDRELRAAAQRRAPKQPNIDTNVNPHRVVIKEHCRLRGPAWAKSQAGRDWIAGREAAADEWDRQRRAEIAEAKRRESVQPLVDHAAAQTQRVFDDPAFSVEDCEHAQAALDSARAGDRDAYVAWEKDFHSQVAQRLADEAASLDSQSRDLKQRRDDLLDSALDKPEPVPEVKEWRMPKPDPYDHDMVSIGGKIVKRSELELE